MKKELQIALLGAEVKAGTELTADMLACLEKVFSEKEQEIEALKEELAGAKTEVSKHTKEVEGSFKYLGTESKMKNKTFRFKKGHLSVRLPKALHANFGSEPVAAADLISDKKFKEAMNHLVEIGFGGLEEVTE